MPKSLKKSYEPPQAWSDRFSTPSVNQLRVGLGSAHARQHFDAVREHLLELDSIRESLAWYGDCWRWSIEYHTKLSKPSADPLAVIIPCPGDLQVSLKIEREFSDALAVKRLKRGVRDGLELAQEPFNTTWAVWSIGTISAANLLEDLQALIEMKLKHLAKRSG